MQENLVEKMMAEVMEKLKEKNNSSGCVPSKKMPFNRVCRSYYTWGMELDW